MFQKYLDSLILGKYVEVYFKWWKDKEDNYK